MDKKFNGFKSEESYNKCFDYLKFVLSNYDERIFNLALYKEDGELEVCVNDAKFVFTSEGLVHLNMNDMVSCSYKVRTDKTFCKILTALVLNSYYIWFSSIE